jgi:hypothetical protein
MPCSVVVGHQHSLHPEDGGSMGLRKVGIILQPYTPSQPTRPGLELSAP